MLTNYLRKMLNFTSILIFSLIVGCCTGFVFYYLIWGIDRMMNYGGIFWKVRFNKYLKYCTREEKNIAYEVYSLKSDNQQIPDIVARIDFLNTLYWKKAAEYTSLKLWLCTECMTIRFTLYANFLTAIYFMIYFGWVYILIYIPMNIVSLSITYYNVRNNELQNNG